MIHPEHTGSGIFQRRWEREDGRREEEEVGETSTSWVERADVTLG